jgi:hypothetical protein
MGESTEQAIHFAGATLDRGVVIDVLRTHPVVIVGGVLYPNPLLVPPEEFLRELRGRLGD